MRIFSAPPYSEWSMRRKLFGHMLLLAILLLLTLLAGLLLTGRFDSAGKNAAEALELQMEMFEKDVATAFSRLAAAGISLTEDLAVLLDAHCAARGLTVEDLSDNAAEIAAVQELLLEPLRQKLLQENCSGVFLMLEATANRRLAGAAHSRTGLYLQRSGYKTANKSVSLYRGLAEVGRRHHLVLHNSWRLEFRTDVFPNYKEAAALAGRPREEAWMLTGMVPLPGTSERVLLLALPVVGEGGRFYGVCGFEISASYFATYHAQPTKLSHLTCLLTGDSTEDGLLDADQGLSCGVSKDYYRAPRGALALRPAQHGLSRLTGEELSYIGLTRTLSLSPSNPPHTLAVLMLRSDYDRAVTTSLLQNVLLWALLLFFAVSCCLFFSRHYLTPIQKSLEQIKSDRREAARSPYPEINDLFLYLAEQDRKHEDSLHALAEEKQAAQSERDRLEQEYHRARLVYDKARNDCVLAQTELAEARRELDRLASSRKSEIDPADYQHFLTGIGLLTVTERRIFDWYLEGKSAKEILVLSGIMESTLKYHNRNILGKLGLSSRKQMLRYAALMKQQEQAGESE
ncbi:MAG: helix-turn-helix domain-containing protein [Clostridia bacterium]|nr:helix-turn-helix domain-containing protein [Clostridia bacterium]